MAETLRGLVHESPVRRQPDAQNGEAATTWARTSEVSANGFFSSFLRTPAPGRAENLAPRKTTRSHDPESQSCVRRRGTSAGL